MATKSKPDRGDEEHRFQQPLERRDAGGQRRDEVRRGEEPHGLAATAARADFQQHDGDDGEQADQQPDGREEAGIEFVPEFGSSWHPPPAGVGQDDFQAEEEAGPG